MNYEPEIIRTSTRQVIYVKVKIKESHYRSGQAQTVPES